MLTTDDSGDALASVAYTAFGEAIGAELDTRYQYAGGWGYESELLVLEGPPGSAPITLMHVGHRWYDPALGRFIQRDPIGIFGGLNLYEYAGSNPLAAVDPNGEWWSVVIRLAIRGGTRIVRIAIRVPRLGPGLGRPAPPFPPRVPLAPEQWRDYHQLEFLIYPHPYPGECVLRA
jgi:RHS repeat-associated protein